MQFSAYAKNFISSDYTEEAFIVVFFGCPTTLTTLIHAICRLSKGGLNGTLIIGLNATASATTPSAT